ncbi:MAG: hypothetical protein ACI9CF_001884 [Candidatus Omnitrophota bacterium]
MKKLINIAIIVCVVLFALSIAKNSIVKASVTTVCKAVTGLDLNIKSLNVGIMNTLVTVKGMQMQNPKTFVDRVMFDLPEIHIDYDLAAIIKGDIHLEEVRLNLAEFVIVKNAAGELNLDALKPAGSEEKVSEKDAKSAEPKAKSSKTPEVRIDSLSLKIGKVIYKDYSKGGEPTIKEFNVNIDETHKNITNIQALIPLLVTKALMNTTIASLANFNPAQILSEFDLGGIDLDKLGSSSLSDLSSNFGSETQATLSKITESLGSQGDKVAPALQSLFGGNDTDESAEAVDTGLSKLRELFGQE